MEVNISQLRIFAMMHRLMEIQQEKRHMRVVLVDSRPIIKEELVLTIRKHQFQEVYTPPIEIKENHKRSYKYHR